MAIKGWHMKIEMPDGRLVRIGTTIGKELPKLERPLNPRARKALASGRSFRSITLKLTVLSPSGTELGSLTGTSYCNPLDNFEHGPDGRKYAVARLFEKNRVAKLLSREDCHLLADPLLHGRRIEKKKKEPPEADEKPKEPTEQPSEADELKEPMKQPATDDGSFHQLREDYLKGGRTNPIAWGPYETYAPAHFGPQLGAHVEMEWTCPDHWAHDNYQRGHLPQLCIKASGWKARLLSILLFWTIKKFPVE